MLKGHMGREHGDAQECSKIYVLKYTECHSPDYMLNAYKKAPYNKWSKLIAQEDDIWLHLSLIIECKPNPKTA